MNIYRARQWNRNKGTRCLVAVLVSLLLISYGNTVFGMGMDWGDPDPGPTVGFTLASQTVEEQTGVATITVQLSEATDQDVTVPFTVSGTASGGAIDYTVTASPLTITAGQISAGISLTITRDSMDEPDETVLLIMDEPTNADLGTIAVHTLTITDGELLTTDPVNVVMADCQRVDTVDTMLLSPTDVALGKDGRVYVSDSYSDTVVVMSFSGKYLTSLKGLARPLSVAVDETGRIYVANLDRENVEVYDPDLNFLFKLGDGDGEFKHPRDIAIDASGLVYVVDMKADTVKMYDSDGGYVGLLGSPGSGGGEFQVPLSITFDEQDEEIIVLDRGNGARVQFFSLPNKYYSRSFYKFSAEIGGLIRPQHIEVDKEHRLYISDSAQNVVLSYDNNGNFLDAVYDMENQVRSPLGLALSETNLLYVASRVTKKIEIFGLDNYTYMQVDPDKLVFTAQDKGSNPAPQSISITNKGLNEIPWGVAIEGDATWLSLSDNGGVLGKGQTALVDVVIDISTLDPGQYTANLKVSGGTGAIETVQIVLEVEALARLLVAPTQLSLTSEVGSTPPPERLTIANIGPVPLIASISADQPWISLSNRPKAVHPKTGEEVLVQADISSLNAGTYTGTITVTGLNTNGFPVVIGVNLTLTEPTGTSGGGVQPPPDDRVFGDINWTLQDVLPSVALNSVWTSSDSQVFAVGDEGMILHYDGLDWGVMESPTSLDLFGVWGVVDPGTGATDVYAVGQNGTILHYNGLSWTTMITNGQDLYGIWGASALDVYAVGQEGTILHYNGSNWSRMDSSITNTLYGVWGFTDNSNANTTGLYVVGERGTIASYNGAMWQIFKTSCKSDLYGVWGSSPAELYAVGQGGAILKSGAYRWSPVDSSTRMDLNGIWGSSATDIYTVGDRGTILHSDGGEWSGMSSPTEKALHSVHGNWETGVFAAGQNTTLLYYDSGNWQSLVSALEGLNSVWGRSSSDVYAVGMLGSIMHYDGNGWTAMESPTTNALHSVWTGTATNVFAVGTSGTIVRYIGQGWSSMESPTSMSLYGVWGSSPTRMYAVGQRGTLLSYNGTDWNNVKTKAKEDLYGIWGRSATDVYMVGQNGAIYYYNGMQVQFMASPTDQDLYSVRGCSGTSVFAVGQGGTFLQYDGISWTSLASTTTNILYDVWCSSATDVVVVGQNDTFLYYDGKTVQSVNFGTGSTLRGVWGSIETTDIFAVGSDGTIIHGVDE